MRKTVASNSLLESLLFAKRAAQDITAGYARTDLKRAAAAEARLDLTKYDNVPALLKSYKQQVQKAIQEAENEQPHN